MQNITIPTADVPGVVKNRHVRVEDLGRLSGPFVVAQQSGLGRLLAVFQQLGIKALRGQVGQPPFGSAGLLRNDIEKNPVAIRKQAHCLFDLGAEKIEIRTEKIHHEKSRLEWRSDPAAEGPFGVDLAPVRVFLSRHIVHSGGEVNGSGHADLLAGVELGAQQIEIQMGVNFADLGRMVTPAMMAFGEERDRIHPRFLQGVLPAGLVEFGPDGRDVRRGVKIEVDLAEGQRLWFHKRSNGGN